MTGSTLIAHCGAERMTREALRGLATPEPMGRFHRPIPHATWADKVEERAAGFGLKLVREDHAVMREHTLYSTFDFEADPAADIVALPKGRLHSLGSRGANDQSINRQAACGQRITVCDNGLFDGGLISLTHKQTKGFDLDTALDEMLARYVVQSNELETKVLLAQEKNLSATAAKGLIFDAFIRNDVMPLRYMKAVARDYFTPEATDEDPATDLLEFPNTLWHLHNSFTRAARGLKTTRRFEATAKLGGLLNLAAEN